MRARTLLLLRVSIGGLMIWWGIDKLANVEHGIAVARHFYLGLGASAALLQIFGVLQIILGVLVVAGFMRRWAYPALLLVTAATLLGVWRSVLDPWGWIFEDANALFYPSLIIFAASAVLWAFRDDDRLALDNRRRG